MNIVFDFEITRTPVAFSGEKWDTFIEGLRLFVYDRLKLLKDEIDLYPEGATVLNFFGTLPRNPPKGVYHKLFPPELKTKMESCVTDEDLFFIFTRLSDWMGK